MKNMLYLFMLFGALSCSSTPEPELPEYSEIQKESEYIYLTYPAEVNNFTALGVGVARLPVDVLASEITVSPPKGRRIYFQEEKTIAYNTMTGPLVPLPKR